MPKGLFGLLVVFILLLSAILAPILAPRDPAEQDLIRRLQTPTPGYWLGTDPLGRDLLSRILYGARISLSIGLASVAIGASLGVTVGLLAGFYGGRVEMFLMSAIDVLLGFRTYLLAILVVAILGSSLANLMLAIGLAIFPEITRLIRAEVISVRRRDYIEAARAVGVSDHLIMTRHILPNVLASLLVVATFHIATAITVESALSFLSLGPPPPTPSWGLMISEGRKYIISAPWLPSIPGFAIMVTVLGFNLLGDSLRDVLDPRLRGR